MTDWLPSAGAVDAEVADALRTAFGAAPFELRWSLAGDTAVRVLALAGPVAPRHAEAPDAAAPWSASARCGTAAAWLLAPAAPPGEAAARTTLRSAVDRHTALVLQRLAAHRAALAGDLLEALTHRLRTDVVTLQAVAEGTLAGMFGDTERADVAREVGDVGREAQRRLSAAREAMTALQSADAREPEPIGDVLRAELDGAGVDVPLDEPAGERARAALPAPGWAACARIVAEALATDPRLGGDAAILRIVPDPLGWAVEAGRPGAARPSAWTARALGRLAGAGHIVAAGGGAASAATLEPDGVRVRVTVPAAPSC